MIGQMKIVFLTIISVLILILGITLPAFAQFSRTNLETGGLYTALAKDGNNNLYVTRVQPGTFGARYEVEKYTNGSGTPAVIYTGLTHAIGNYPWGLAVTSTGNVYISADFTSNKGAIIKLTYSGGNYTGTTFQIGRYFTALAVDAGDNLYTTEYDSVHTSYAVVKYGANSAAYAAGTQLYDNLKSALGYAYPTGLTIATNGDVYVTDAFSNVPNIIDGGRVYKLTAASAYAVSTISSGNYSSALALDAGGNLFSSENNGAGYQLVEYPSGGGSGFSVFSPMHTNGRFYPWGIAVINNDKIFAIDGDDGVLGCAVMLLKSANANLSAFHPSNGTLSPLFAPATTNYTTSVGNGITSITVTPTTSDATATVKVNGTAVTSGTASGAIPLIVGPNTITTIVTAPDGVTTKTYTLTITRAPSSNANLAWIKLSSGTLSPVFAAATTSYTASVSNATTSITVTPTAVYSTTTITVNGTAVTSGTASPAIPLSVGPNTITLIGTAQDGVTTKTYTVVVGRGASNANLSSISLSSGTLSPVFAAATTSYTASVTNATTSITVTPTTSATTATVTVNGVAVNSGTASAAIPLTVGPNIITLIGTAQDGVTTKTYTVTVTRISSNAKLAWIKLSSGMLSPTFAATTTSYTASVPNATSSITVTPTAVYSTTTITVNGTAVTSGTASSAIPLSVGPNTITLIGTAQDGVTTKTYTVTVTRISSNAKLALIHLSSGTLSPTFAAATTSYTASVTNATTSITVTPTAVYSTTTITVNGTAVTSGTASGSIALAQGPNTITLITTAQDGVTKMTYTVTVTRATGPVPIATPQSYVENTTNNLPNDGIVVHQGVSPNGDGTNDILTIDGITNYPDNKLVIINRSGELVFEAKGYDNSTKVFDGHSNKTGKLQQPGTYFYSLEYKDGGVTKNKTGFIVLKY
jgi:gliding motility-associated-like protein